ncbi:hypothetical protein Cgig2_012851 [Carnegiea gigantea]|uniref:Uncharacterized protein n=1 Tax=Carnegiea gigantea TaxID=171969 RepID=A0A9Q1GTD8_9CARY|nr:hypothetical protein Cgig2_012851 [Carnegiea gigantea]
MEAVNSVRPLPTFNYVPIAGYEPSYSHAPVGLFHRSDEAKETVCLDRDDGSRDERLQANPRKPREIHHFLYALRNSFPMHLLIDNFLKQEPQFLLKEGEPARLELSEEECSAEIVAIIVGRYTEEQGIRTMVPTMVFDGRKSPHFTSPHNNPLVIELKVTSALIRQILIDTRSSVDIITRDSLKRLKHPGRQIVPLVHAILGFGRQEVNPTGIIRL